MTEPITYQKAHAHYLRAVRLSHLSHTKKVRRIAEIQKEVSDCNDALHDLYGAGLVVSVEGLEERGFKFKEYGLQRLYEKIGKFKEFYFPEFRKDIMKSDLPGYGNAAVQLKPDCFWTGFSYARPVNEGFELGVLENKATTEQTPDCGCGDLDDLFDM